MKFKQKNILNNLSQKIIGFHRFYRLFSLKNRSLLLIKAFISSIGFFRFTGRPGNFITDDLRSTTSFKAPTNLPNKKN